MIDGPSPRLGVVLVNWNRWSDTIECLETLLRSTIPLRIVVVDNASSDGSSDRIAEWAAGATPARALSPVFADMSQPGWPKPIVLRRLDAGTAATATPDTSTITLIDAGGNLGFAGGNNVGLRFLFRASPIRHVWLLNNDTVVEPDAAMALLARMEATHKIGMCGTIVRYYHRPDVVQALNGSRFNLFTGQSRGIGEGQPGSMPFDPAKVARETDFVLGASLGVSRAFFETVGPMTEDYFLYFEEIDWAARNAGRFAIAFAHGAVVYHKEGGSIGSSAVKGRRSDASDYYLLRSRLGFIRRRALWLLPLHWLLALGQIARRLLRLQPKKALVLLRALLGLQMKTISRG
ncbi:glycosyltransferase family 2 protein [Glacieibacterium megasporae]|uniref:glycosyltransferase family 2 protein n=1 Tax=Glacieibacterium megasporae TaxID=2835787 RepID=UPI001C1DD982|nr:glycosyltransferase family 2 protein [Polymorphobacter megasporae]UAJ09329.1 glycosyltransferase family 2 protein [Polymorphobacter megasporae]